MICNAIQLRVAFSFLEVIITATQGKIIDTAMLEV
jgi:hypothetical protein